MRLADPWYLLLLLALPPWIWWGATRAASTRLTFSDLSLFADAGGRRLAAAAGWAPLILRVTAVTLVIVALARPQTGYSEEEITSRGIDIMLTLDLSSSMSASDLAPDRLTAAKRVIADFIDGRVNDRIGLVVFAAQGYTQCPLTLDYATLTAFLDRSYIGFIDDGTAIGMALATAANRLRDSEAASKIVVLLTDGVNNRGAIDPLTAAEVAQAVGVRVYTIGVGKEGVFTQTVDDPLMGRRRVQVQTEIDERLLRNIANRTGGRFYRAQDEAALAAIYTEIDTLEKTDVKMKVYMRYSDWFPWLLAPAALLLLLELLTPWAPWRTLP